MINIYDPQQELFTELLVEIEKKYPNRVYDGEMPPAGTAYPFIYMGNTQEVDDVLKMGATGELIQTIKVLSNTPNNRGTVSEIVRDIKCIAYDLHRTDNFSLGFKYCDTRFQPDNTTEEPLLGAVVELHFNYS